MANNDTAAGEAQQQKQIYDDIVDEYSSIKTNPYKHFVEEPTFWSVLGDISNKTILDLACGSGHFSRQMRSRGPHLVLGVDVSSEMIAEAEKIENDDLDHKNKKDDDDGGKLLYCCADATKIDAFMPLLRKEIGDDNALFDIVTAQYLFPYADSRDALKRMCQAAFDALKPGGYFYSITCCFSPAPSADSPPLFKSYSQKLGYRIQWPGQEDQNNDIPPDGVCVQMTIFGAGHEEDSSTSVTFPNFFWSRDTIAAAARAVGFENPEWKQEISSEEGKGWFEEAEEDFGLVGYLACRKSAA